VNFSTFSFGHPGLRGDDEAEETTEDDDVDVGEESEDDLDALIEEATEVVSLLSGQIRQRTPQKRFDPHQELRDKVANFKKERRRELEQEILSKTGTHEKKTSKSWFRNFYFFPNKNSGHGF
jgi:hypothetical protein